MQTGRLVAFLRRAIFVCSSITRSIFSHHLTKFRLINTNVIGSITILWFAASLFCLTSGCFSSHLMSLLKAPRYWVFSDILSQLFPLRSDTIINRTATMWFGRRLLLSILSPTTMQKFSISKQDPLERSAFVSLISYKLYAFVYGLVVRLRLELMRLPTEQHNAKSVRGCRSSHESERPRLWNIYRLLVECLPFWLLF